MDRELFEIEAPNDAWAVVGVIPDPIAYPTKLQAIHQAARLSYRHFVLTGAPTGVKVQMHCGDQVLMAMHG